MQKINKTKTGRKYEDLAVEYLLQKGYEILERNFRCPCGEIDVIARDHKTLVFLEVKYRAGSCYGTPWEAVDLRKQRRISRAALYYYGANGYEQDLPCRFDVIGFDRAGRLAHLENAFDYIS